MSTPDGADRGWQAVPDEWITATEPPRPPARPGPAMLDADSWEEHAELEATVETYEGRRRAGGSAVRMWVVLGVVLAGLGAVIAIPLALVANRHHSGPQATATTAGEPTADGTTPAVTLVPATGAAGAPTTPPPTTRSTFSVTLEAEGPGTVLSGSARVDEYPGASGGEIVRNVGRWNGNPGSIRWSVTLPAAGPYVITIWYVLSDSEHTRSAQISVSGVDTVTRSFSGNSDCCSSLSLSPMNLAAGSHTVTIGNPSGHAPSIDKIVIARA